MCRGGGGIGRRSGFGIEWCPSDQEQTRAGSNPARRTQSLAYDKTARYPGRATQRRQNPHPAQRERSRSIVDAGQAHGRYATSGRVEAEDHNQEEIG